MSKRAAAAAAASEEDDTPQIDPELFDPLDPRRLSLDIFEVYCHEMLNTGEVGRRAFLIKKMRYMIHRLIGTQYEYGRLYNYSTLANLVARVCARRAYHGDDENEIQLTDRLIDLDVSKWEKIIKQLTDVRDSLLRKDASLTLLPTEIAGTPGADVSDDEDWLPSANDEVNEELETSEAFSESFLQMKDWLKFHACLSCIQPQFQNALDYGTDVVPMENIANFDRTIGKHFAGDEDNEFAEILRSLFSNGGKAARKKQAKKVLSLKSLKDIKSIHADNSRVFDLEVLQMKLLKLVRQWVKLALPLPTLARLGYGSKDTTEKADKANTHCDTEDVEVQGQSAVSSESPAKQPARKQQKGRIRNELEKFFADSDDEDLEARSNIDQLKRKRESFVKKINDPLEESIARAAALPERETTKPSPKVSRLSAGGSKDQDVMHNFCQPKKSAHRLEWIDSDDELSENEKGDLTMTEVPERLKHAEDTKPAAIDIQLPGQRSGPTKRRRFTEEEDQAILKGVERFGSGKWTEIKSYFPMELKNRNTVQIKDRHRTLTKSAE